MPIDGATVGHRGLITVGRGDPINVGRGNPINVGRGNPTLQGWVDNSIDSGGMLLYLPTDMEATNSKITVVGLPDTAELDGTAGHYLRRGSVHPCEQCKCCSCMRVCTMCHRNCSPTDSSFVPVIGCPDFVHMRETPPVRYTYRTGYDFEYRLRLPGSR